MENHTITTIAMSAGVAYAIGLLDDELVWFKTRDGGHCWSEATRLDTQGWEHGATIGQRLPRPLVGERVSVIPFKS